MKESVIEQYLARQAAARGGWALKFVSPGNAGVPDRLVAVPTGECPCCGRRASVGLMELKAPGEEPRPLQHRQMERLAGIGVPVGWASSHVGVDAWLAALASPGSPGASRNLQEAANGGR